MDLYKHVTHSKALMKSPEGETYLGPETPPHTHTPVAPWNHFFLFTGSRLYESHQDLWPSSQRQTKYLQHKRKYGF